MDRLKALATFKMVVDKGGFARAAAELDVSCAQVTRCVQELEALLGVRLLQRTTRRIALTSVGEEVLQRAHVLLSGFDALAAVSSLSASEPSGTIRVLAPPAYGRHFLGSALAEFMSLHPKVWVELRLRDAGLNDSADDVDLQMCLTRDLRPAMIARHVASLDVGLYAAPRYLAGRGEPQSPADLADHLCLTCDDTRQGAGWRLRHTAAGVCTEVAVKGVMHSNHADVLVGAAEQGAGLALLPSFMVADAVAQGRLYRVMHAWSGEPLGVHLVYASRINQPLAVRRLIDHLVLALDDDNPSSLPPHRHAMVAEAPALVA